MGWYIGIGIAVLFIAYIIYGVRKMKNIENVPPSRQIKILNNKNFKEIVRKNKVLVDFWAPWCAPCKMIAPVLNEIADENPGKITIAKLDVDQNKPLAQKFNIRNIPTMILFQDGKEVKRISGVKSKKVLLRELDLI
jgi:thioredoxin